MIDIIVQAIINIFGLDTLGKILETIGEDVA